ncbi:YbaB/EbfC family nucleoid-associated protein [Gordonia sp. CPCC 205515]|uniref:YbaB/EbfC family nucleoid-associated protein n=1 Tax=Gordonia sp. CPCC 205515 TaxID=3140791 RepID=UPI003AF394B9
MGDLNALVGQISDAQQLAATLTATATGLDGRITVSVNARGIVTDVLIDEDALTQVTGRDLGSAIAATAREAAADVDRRMAAVWQPINEGREKMPLASDLFEGLPKVDDILASMAQPPNSSPSPTTTGDEYFENVEEPAAQRSSFQDRAW